MLGGETFDHFGHRFWSIRNFADKAHLATLAALGGRNRDHSLVRIHCNVGCCKLIDGSFSMPEALADSPATLVLACRGTRRPRRT
jgi:hypothetical protein